MAGYELAARQDSFEDQPRPPPPYQATAQEPLPRSEDDKVPADFKLQFGGTVAEGHSARSCAVHPQSLCDPKSTAAQHLRFKFQFNQYPLATSHHRHFTSHFLKGQLLRMDSLQRLGHGGFRLRCLWIPASVQAFIARQGAQLLASQSLDTDYASWS
ncbi:hypothetical protein BDW66DRAFT_125507 [Aspergillus desertorum]